MKKLKILFIVSLICVFTLTSYSSSVGEGFEVKTVGNNSTKLAELDDDGIWISAQMARSLKKKKKRKDNDLEIE
jgi:hypothetical protein